MEDGTFGMHGVALLANLYGGREHRLHLRLLPRSRQYLRIEVSGYATRFQRCFCDLNLEQGTVDPAEEISAVAYDAAPDGAATIEVRFFPYLSAREWIYVYVLSKTREGSLKGSNAKAFEIAHARLSVEEDARRPLRPVWQNPAHRLDTRTWFALQEILLLRNYVHIQFELHREATWPVGLTLRHPDRALGPLRWFMGQLPLPAQPRHRCDDELQPEGAKIIRSPALMDVLGPDFANCGQVVCGLFAEWTDLALEPLDVSDRLTDFTLKVRFEDNSTVAIPLGLDAAECWGKPADDTLKDRFWREITSVPAGTFLEVGGRGSNARANRKRLPAGWKYLGFDIHSGDNVDVVGDAHVLSRYFGSASIDVVYADQVVEHLAVPWRFVLEANRVLKSGGLFFIESPSAWPLHAEPWDYWRFSDHAWPSLLNEGTGFEIVETSLGWRVVVVPSKVEGSGITRTSQAPAFSTSAVLARKVGEATAQWAAYRPAHAVGRYERVR